MRLTITSKPQINRILVPTIISSISFFVVFGFARLRPSNIAWLSYTDWQDGWGAYLGWESYRQSRYSSPIGLNYNYGLELELSIANYQFRIAILTFLYPFTDPGYTLCRA